MEQKESLNLEDRLGRIEGLLATQKSILNVDEVATFIGRAKSYVYKLTSRNEIPWYKPKGKCLYFKREEIESWMLQNRAASLAEINQESANRAITSGRRTS